jgi:D-glycero-alpha-D-manno-heptose 1-phosphate guanylyltransferase
MDSVTAILLAGGLGTRLRSVVSDGPKVLATVAGKPFLFHLLDQVHRAGIDRAIISTGYMADLVQQAIGTRYTDITIDYAAETEPLGTGGALRFAAAKLDCDTALVMNADSYVDCDLAAFASDYFCSGRGASIMVTRVEDASRYGSIEIAPNGDVASFNEKLGTGAPGWINAGIYCVARAAIAGLPDAIPLSLEREVWPALIPNGINTFRCAGDFIDIGTPESYRAAEAFFAARAQRPAARTGE